MLFVLKMVKQDQEEGNNGKKKAEREREEEEEEDSLLIRKLCYLWDLTSEEDFFGPLSSSSDLIIHLVKQFLWAFGSEERILVGA